MSGFQELEDPTDSTRPTPRDDAQARWPLIEWLRRFAGVWGFALFVLLVLVLFRAVVLPFVLGLLVAYILAPAVDWLSRPHRGRRLPRWVAVLVCYVLIAGGIAAFLTIFLPRLSRDVARLVQEAPVFFRKVQTQHLPRFEAWVDTTFAEHKAAEIDRPPSKLVVTETRPGRYEIDLEGLDLEIEPAGKGRFVIGPRNDTDRRRTPLYEMMGQLARSTESEISSVLLFGQRFVTSTIKSIAWFVLMFMVAAYLLVDLERVRGFLRSVVPQQVRGAYDEVVFRIDRGMSGVIRGQLMICLVNGVLTTIGLVIFQVKYYVLLGMVAGALSFIPVFGSILSSVPIVTMALISGQGISVGTAFGVLLWIIGIHLVEANFLNPKIMGTAAKIHPLVVVFALMGGEHAGGLIGALLAVPIASIVQVMFVYLREQRAKSAAG